MDKEFTFILNKIEGALKNALPKKLGKNWQEASFAKLPETFNACYLANLAAPNERLISLGGKRWRPLLLILCWQASAEKNPDAAVSEDTVYNLTPLVEFVHTASLIHDDIEDSADLRRGQPAAHITYGLDTALNAASWLYFQAPVCINMADISDSLKLTLYSLYTQELRRLHLGQAMDIYWHRNPAIFPSQEDYFTMVKCKTGTLASLAAQVGTLAGGSTLEEAAKTGEIAANIGIGFQIIDDVINLTTGNPGKKRGDDIVEGKKSLPVILHSQKHQEDKEKLASLMAQAAKEGIESPAVEEAIKILESSGCIEQAAKEGSRLIYENSRLLASSQIENLFVSMIPQNFRK